MIKLCYWEIKHWKRQIKGEGVIAKDSEKTHNSSPSEHAWIIPTVKGR